MNTGTDEPINTSIITMSSICHHTNTSTSNINTIINLQLFGAFTRTGVNKKPFPERLCFGQNFHQLDPINEDELGHQQEPRNTGRLNAFSGSFRHIRVHT
jgi:hypothetical protein